MTLALPHSPTGCRTAPWPAAAERASRRWRRGHRRQVWLLALAVGLALPPTLRALDNADCFVCHADRELTASAPAADGQMVSLFVDEETFAASIHGALECTACHADLAEVPHAASLAPVRCGACHPDATETYLGSDHGRAIAAGIGEAAACRSCHGEPHAMLGRDHAASPMGRPNIPATCGQCHGNTEEMEQHHLHQPRAAVSYDQSVHGVAHRQGDAAAAVCTDCHGVHDLQRSNHPDSKLHWQQIPRTCGQCHGEITAVYERSVHGQAVADGRREAPVCTDCHGEHTIQAIAEATSTVAPAHIPETCGQCHAAERITSKYELEADVVETYMQSFHGLGIQFGGRTVANCASCHGYHDILPSTDPRSSIHRTNLPQTCGQCHPGIGTRLAAGDVQIHTPPGAAAGKPWLVNLVTWIYLGLIVVTIGGMLVHNLIDYLHKTRAHLRWARAQDGEPRLGGWMRFQHLVLIFLFVVLAYTGFVHAFPDAFFSWPFRVLDDGGYLRDMIHRVAGWLFTALVVGHLAALVGTRRGRTELRGLWLRGHDLKDLVTLVGYNLGLRPNPPPPRRWNYIEKSEYWALIWGSVMMILTGVMLVFTEAMLRIFPKVWHDVAQVIHYYEAVLATLAIVVWHFYWVIFDPQVYPMNPAWLIGKKAPPPADPQPPPAPAPPEAGDRTGADQTTEKPDA